MDKELFRNALKDALSLGYKAIPYGEVATYIPELGKADKNALGIAVRLNDGDLITAGDCSTRFSIQSISKIITLLVALERFGSKAVFDRVGMEPSGEAFNSLIELDTRHNKPFNPMVNSGAIAVASMLVGHVTFEEMTELVQRICHDEDIVEIDTFKELFKTKIRSTGISINDKSPVMNMISQKETFLIPIKFP